jgi:sugar lactone lactonase YvrE
LQAAAAARGTRRHPAATVYGLQRGKLLQKITDGIDHPTALAFDASGELYVANKEPRGGSTYSGSVSVYAAGASKPARILAQTANPDALAFDDRGYAYVANKWYHAPSYYCSLGSVGVYAPGQTIPLREIGGNGYVVEPRALAFDAAGNLYVANNIIAYGSCGAGNTVTIFAPNVPAPSVTISDGIDYPCALALAPGVLYVANAPPKGVKHLPYGSVTEYDLSTNALLRTITDGIRTPDALALDGKGNLYVGNLNGRNVSVYTPGSTSPSRVITQGATSPKALLFGARGNLYVANLYQNTISAYDPGKNSPRLTIHVPIADPVSIALSP